MNKIIIVAVILAMSAMASAQDPGDRDTIIVETVFVDTGQTSIDVRIWATSDDSVMFYNMPLIWTSPDFLITPSGVTYYNVLLDWDDVFDSTLSPQGFIRMLGWADIAGPDNPPLLTYNARWHCWTITFSVDPSAAPQYVGIDTTNDFINGSLLFGLSGGVISFIPEFISGGIFYGIQSGIGDDDQILPREFALIQNYPNPFNASTTIKFELPRGAEVDLSIYNLLGQRVAVVFEGAKPAGYHSITWNSGDMPSGVYFARLESETESRNIKMVLLK